MSKELEAAADKYFGQYRNPMKAPDTLIGFTQIDEHFKAGAQWAIRNAPEVKALVEALEKITDTMDADTHIPKMAIAEKALVAYRKSLGEE